jgi:ornithine cyclodeaminase/alanine dehydrogenase-like protein (mu-crystallin family)
VTALPAPPLLYLTEDEVQAHLPPPEVAVPLASRALAALADGAAELPPKPAVHPRSDAFANAMPAYVADGDLLGLKWIAHYPANADLGRPVLNGLVLLSDATTGEPAAVMGAGELTGVRTAAVSGACIATLGPHPNGHSAITGAGLQARTHLAMLEHLDHTRVTVFARREQSAQAIQAWAAEHVPTIELTCARSARAAVDGASIVITALPIGAPDALLDAAWIDDDALLLPLDYGTSVGADIANPAALFADDTGQLLRYRGDGAFPGYRDPDGYCGDAIRRPRPEGRVVCQNLGNGAADLLFADYVLRSARAAGSGTELTR